MLARIVGESSSSSIMMNLPRGPVRRMHGPALDFSLHPRSLKGSRKGRPVHGSLSGDLGSVLLHLRRPFGWGWFLRKPLESIPEIMASATLPAPTNAILFIFL